MMKAKLFVSLLFFVVLNICYGWGQSFNMPSMQQPQMIMPQMPQFDTQKTFWMPNMNMNVPSIGMPQYHMPSMQMPTFQMPVYQGVFSSSNGKSDFNRQSENVFNNIKMPTNQVNPMMIDPFKGQGQYKILSNIVPNGKLPGSVSHLELSRQEMQRIGFSPRISNLENNLMAENKSNAVSFSDSSNLVVP